MREFANTHNNSQSPVLSTNNASKPERDAGSRLLSQHPINDHPDCDLSYKAPPTLSYDFSPIPVSHRPWSKVVGEWAPCGGGSASAGNGECNVVQASEKVSSLQQHVDVSVTEVDPSTEAQNAAKAEPNIVGLAWPECIRAKITARRSLDGTGPVWRAHLTGVVGWYSRQSTLTPTQEEVGGIGHNTTEENFCDQVEELNALGHFPGRWYMLAAVKAHENVHASHFKEGLLNVVPQLKVMFNKWTVPLREHESPKNPHWLSRAEAVGEFVRDPLVQQEAWAARNLFWKPEVDKLIKGDHSGPTAAAEHKVVDPMIRHICNYAKRAGWPECPYCEP